MAEYTYRYPHPAVAADCVVFGHDGHGLHVLLIERGGEPCKGMWAFPGGFMNIDETAEEAARRELHEETHLAVGDVHQLGAYTDVHRDPRERVISIVYYTVADMADVQGDDDARQARWWPVTGLPGLAFDHDTILRDALLRLHQSAALRTTPEMITRLEQGQIFVFGSNIQGMHGGGAAAIAVQKFGAVYGQGDGLQGQSYAISTMEGLEAMAAHVADFIAFARRHREMTFMVTRIGCGIAGYTPAEVAPMFAPAIGLENVHLPRDFWRVLL